MNTVAIREYIVSKYNAQILCESLAVLEYYKIDIIMSFPNILFSKCNDDYPLSKLNIEVLYMRKNEKEIKIVFEHNLGYYTIKGLDEFDPDANDLSKELSKVGEKD